MVDKTYTKKTIEGYDLIKIIGGWPYLISSTIDKLKEIKDEIIIIAVDGSKGSGKTQLIKDYYENETGENCLYNRFREGLAIYGNFSKERTNKTRKFLIETKPYCCPELVSFLLDLSSVYIYNCGEFTLNWRVYDFEKVYSDDIDPPMALWLFKYWEKLDIEPNKENYLDLVLTKEYLTDTSIHDKFKSSISKMFIDNKIHSLATFRKGCDEKIYKEQFKLVVDIINNSKVKTIKGKQLTGEYLIQIIDKYEFHLKND